MVWAEDDKIIRTHPTMPLATLTVKRVCNPCNTGWMHKIEDAAIPVLSDLIAGHPRTLRADAIRVAAKWAYLKCLVVELATRGHKPGRVPPEVYPWVREHQRPPSGVLIVAACYGGNRHPLYASSGVADFDLTIKGERTPWRAYALTIGVGHLVFKALGHHLPFEVDLNPAGRNAERTCLIWPEPDHPVRWPPTEPLTNTTLFEFGQQA